MFNVSTISVKAVLYNRTPLSRTAKILEIFAAEVMFYGWAFTQRSGVVVVKVQCSYYAELRIID